jgi:hypothetical protein
VNQIKEPTMATGSESGRIKNNNMNSQSQTANKKTNNINNKNTITKQIQSRRIIREEGNDEVLYFESSDEEEEETLGKRNEIASKRTTEKDIPTTTKVRDDEGTETVSTEERTKATKKKVKVTMASLLFGHVCDNIAIDNDTPYIRVYCQNVCGIFNKDGLGLDSAFKEIKRAGADIFTFNETHGDESNALARRARRLSKQRMWKDNNEDCKIIHSSLTASVLNFTKPGGNMVGITGHIVGQIRDTITDPYRR